MVRNKRARAKTQPAGGAPVESSREDQPTLTALLAGVVTALFVLRPLYPSESVASEGDGLPVVILWLLALALWAAMVARGNLRRARFGWPDVFVALLVLWHSIAALRAVFYESPRPALNMLWEWIAFGVAFFLARQTFTSALQRRAVGAVMVALAVVVSIYGLYQYSIELPAMREAYQHSPDEVLRDAGLWFPPGSPGREQFEQRLASLEPMSTFALTNSLAGFLAPWTMVALAACVVFHGQISTRHRTAIAALLIPIGLCLLLTKSRSAYLASAIGAAAIATIAWGGRWTRVPTRRKLLTIGIPVVLICLAILGVAVTGGLDREVLSEAPKSLGYRLQYWQASAAMIRDLPVFGCGPGNFRHRYTAYKLPEASEEITDPHNFIFEISATAGIPALLAFLGIAITSFLCIVRNPGWRSDEPSDESIDCNPPSGEAFPIFAGVLGGMLLSLPVGIMSAAPPSLLVPLAGLPLAGLVLLVLFPWVARGQENPVLWTLAAITLLIHLLFSGALGFPGVAAGFWLLTALALDSTACGERFARRNGGTLVLGGTVALLVGCFLTGYQPTLLARAHIDRAFHGIGDPRDQLTMAAAADPWAVAPREHLADLFYQQWLTQLNADTLAEFDRAVEEALARAPRSASLRHRFGLAYQQCYTRSHQKPLLDKAIDLLESAIEMYPNDCRKHADLAEAYLLANDRSGYERERSEALRLDAITPHLDKKLKDEQRLRLTRNTSDTLAPDVRAPIP